MPQLSDLAGKRKFVKKAYRPWDLSGSGTVDNKENSTDPVKSESTPIINDSTTVTEIRPIVEHVAVKNLSTEPETDNVTGNISDNIKVTNEKQPDNTQVTAPKQRDNSEITTREQTSNSLDNVTGNTDEFAYLVDAIKKLGGIQKHIFYYVVNLCSARGALNTGNILAIDLSDAANCSTGSAKTSLIRLVEKKLVIRHQGKACRGGHMVLGITKEIQSASIQAQHMLFNPFKMPQSDNNRGNATSNVSPYSSSIYKNNITTTSLPDDWKRIDFEALRTIGFSETQLRQLFESNATTSEIVQASINHFAYALEYKEKVKGYPAPLNVLMGVLRKGQSWNEADYVSPQETSLRKILDEKRKRKEKIDAMIKELVDLDFPAWRKNLTEDDIKQIVSEQTMRANIAPAISGELRHYFVEKVLLPKLERDGLLVNEN